VQNATAGITNRRLSKVCQHWTNAIAALANFIGLTNFAVLVRINIVAVVI
jgi:hypothetical protein